MRKAFLLSMLTATLIPCAQAASTTVYSTWNDFTDLTSTGGTIENTITGMSATDGKLIIGDGNYASLTFATGTEMGWYTGKTSCLQLTISDLILPESGNVQLHTFQGGVASGSAVSSTGNVITNGNNMNSWGSSSSSSLPTDTFTLTIAMSKDNGAQYYVNGVLFHEVSGWVASGRTWTSLDLGKAYKDVAAGSFTVENMELFSIDTTNKIDVSAAVMEQYLAIVPEPTTASLGILGLAALMMRRRRA